MPRRIRQLFSRKEETLLPETALRLNRFIDEVCMGDGNDLTPAQRNAFLCFWYDAEVNNGGHGLYFDCHPEVSPDELADALRAVAPPAIAENFLSAVSGGDQDDYAEADHTYFDFSPSLIDCLQAYVEQRRAEIFNH